MSSLRENSIPDVFSFHYDGKSWPVFFPPPPFFVNFGDENQFDFAINGLLSLNMVVTLLVALVLDNTVPGSRQERGVYIWSSAEDIKMDPSSLSDYSLPKKVARFFGCAKCLSWYHIVLRSCFVWRPAYGLQHSLCSIALLVDRYNI